MLVYQRVTTTNNGCQLPHHWLPRHTSRVPMARYKMLPLWYTLFHQWATASEPVVRPLFWDFLVGTSASYREL